MIHTKKLKHWTVVCGLSLFTACAATLSSCIKAISRGGGTITIKGRLVADCSNTPVASVPMDLYLKSSSASFGGSSGLIGHTTTDVNGYFTVTGTNYGNGSLTIYRDFNDLNSQQIVAGYVMSGGDGTVVNLGTVYEQYTRSVFIRFTRPAASPADTLYFGEYGSEPYDSVIGTAINGYVYSSIVSMSGMYIPYDAQATWTWGIGKAEYKRAADSLAAANNMNNPHYYHPINVHTSICSNYDTAVVTM